MGLLNRLTNDLFRAASAAARDQQRAKAFNLRWHRLNAIVCNVRDSFVIPVSQSSAGVTPRELQKMLTCSSAMMDWQKAISQNIDDATNGHLSKYATSIKKTAILAIQLCQKYEIIKDIQSVRYNSASKQILVNERELFYLGN